MDRVMLPSYTNRVNVTARDATDGVSESVPSIAERLSRAAAEAVGTCAAADSQLGLEAYQKSLLRYCLKPRWHRPEALLRSATDENTLLLNRGVLASVANDSLSRVDERPWPQDVRDAARLELSRIADALAERSLSFYDSASAVFRKEIRLASLTRIPLGVAQAEVDGIPRSRLVLQPPWVAARLLAYIGVQMGGVRPTLDLHVDLDHLSEFHAQGWDDAFLRAAEVLRRNPLLRGVQCSAWFHDPALESISPRLAHLRRRYVDHGGLCIHVGGSQSERNLALVRSATRRQLHAQGRYHPAVWMGIMSRSALLKWASEVRSRPSSNLEPPLSSGP
jgi:hypothetical protein